MPKKRYESPEVLVKKFLKWLLLQNRSKLTVDTWNGNISRFLRWCDERGVTCVSQMTSDILAAYQRHLFHHRQRHNGKPLKFSTQLSYLTPVVRWFVWLTKEEKILKVDPTATLKLPKEGRRLPVNCPTPEQVELAMNHADVSTTLGLRNRAMLEVFYSTGIRCGELINLNIYDVEEENHLVAIRRGKGDKDRVVPIGERALSWLQKYISDSRPKLAELSNETSAIFLSKNGLRLTREYVTWMVRSHITAAGIETRGACHLLRHAAATHMLNAGADLRSLQLFLGHERLNTTQLYTHVSIERLKEVHARTHPAKPNTLEDRE